LVPAYTHYLQRLRFGIPCALYFHVTGTGSATPAGLKSEGDQPDNLNVEEKIYEPFEISRCRLLLGSGELNRNARYGRHVE
jgi:hypothetical protein